MIIYTRQLHTFGSHIYLAVMLPIKHNLCLGTLQHYKLSNYPLHACELRMRMHKVGDADFPFLRVKRRGQFYFPQDEEVTTLLEPIGDDWSNFRVSKGASYDI